MWTTFRRRSNASCETCQTGSSLKPSALPGWRPQVGPAASAHPEIQAIQARAADLSSPISRFQPSLLYTWARHAPIEQSPVSLPPLFLIFIITLYTVTCAPCRFDLVGGREYCSLGCQAEQPEGWDGEAVTEVEGYSDLIYLPLPRD